MTGDRTRTPAPRPRRAPRSSRAAGRAAPSPGRHGRLSARNRMPVPPRKQGGGHRRRTEQERPPRRRLMRSFKRTIATLAVLLLGLGGVAAPADADFTGAYT